ncbi:MAG: hypothetical protein NVSMB9_32930 [Isosphaeraceae bacterium]
MADLNPRRTPDHDNPYAPPEADLVPLKQAFTLPGLPRDLPPFSTGAVLGHAWTIYQERLGICLALVLGAFGIEIAYQVALNALLDERARARMGPGAGLLLLVVSTVVGFVLQNWLAIGLWSALLKVARGQDAKLGDIFNGGPFLLRYLGASILLGLVALSPLAGSVALVAIGAGLLFQVTLGGLIFAVIATLALGGVILALVLSVRFSQFTYVLLDRDCGVVDSLGISWRATRGHVLELISIGILSGLIGVSGLLACGFGLIFTFPFALLISVTTYDLLMGRKTSDADSRRRTDLVWLDPLSS